MAYIVWKAIKGHGPYAYLYKSVKVKGKTKSIYLDYLGLPGEGGPVPGLNFSALPTEDGQFNGGKVLAPPVPDQVAEKLNAESLQALEAVQAKWPSSDPQLGSTSKPKAEAAKTAVVKAPLVRPDQPAKTAVKAVKEKPAAVAQPPAKKVTAKKTPAKLGSTATPAKPASSEPKAKVPAKPKSAATPAPATQEWAKNFTNGDGTTLLAATTIKKLQEAFDEGSVSQLEAVEKAELAKKIPATKKGSITLAVQMLKAQLGAPSGVEADGQSRLPETIEAVADGDLKLPQQATPKPAVVDAQEKAVKSGQKNWDADLEQVSGKKGSNEGGLYKDKHLQTLHYVKWNESATRTKMEELANRLYTLAQVRTPTVRTIKFSGKDAVMSDWIENAQPMTVAEMRKNPDVRTGFVIDAWLANWDVVGLSADNIVKGDNNTAYRIDAGGCLLYRAQGKGKPFTAEVGELESLRNPSINPNGAKVFEGITDKELNAGVERLLWMSDSQIDTTVDAVNLPKTSPDYPASQFGAEAKNLPKMLKDRLKARRDYIVKEISGKAEKQANALNLVKQASQLTKGASSQLVAQWANQYKPGAPGSTTKWSNTRKILAHELGAKAGKQASDLVQDHWKAWKNVTYTEKPAILRWAAGATTSERAGQREVLRLDKFNAFRVKQKALTAAKRKEYNANVQKAAADPAYQPLVSGLNVNRKQNAGILAAQNPEKDTIVLYRWFRPDQSKYLGLDKMKVGDTVNLDDPPLYSWTSNYGTWSGSHGGVRLKTEVPISSVILTDLVNPTVNSSEYEVMFKGVANLRTEVIDKT